MPADLNQTLVFARVAALGSFSKAARALDMPVSSVSRKVSDLEQRLGAVLIRRTTRKLSLTPLGGRLFEQCAVHLQGIEDAESALSQHVSRLEGRMRISVPVALGQGAFVDLISEFLMTHPAVAVDLVVTNRHVDLIADGIDIAIRFGQLKDSSIVATRLGISRRVLVASPAYLAKHRAPTQPAQLSDHDCILFHGASPETEWQLQSGSRKLNVKVVGRVSGSDFNSVYEFAARGQGIAFLPQAYCERGERLQVLRRVLPRWGSAAIPVFALYANRKFLPARLKALLAAMQQWHNPHWQ